MHAVAPVKSIDPVSTAARLALASWTLQTVFTSPLAAMTTQMCFWRTQARESYNQVQAAVGSSRQRRGQRKQSKQRQTWNDSHSPRAGYCGRDWNLGYEEKIVLVMGNLEFNLLTEYNT
jgi:hypothetical protein